VEPSSALSSNSGAGVPASITWTSLG